MVLQKVEKRKKHLRKIGKYLRTIFRRNLERFELKFALDTIFDCWRYEIGVRMLDTLKRHKINCKLMIS